MTDYYPSSPLPAPAPGTLPYPWVTQFDPTHQATFYVNLETQESTWTLPDLSNLPSFNPPPAPAVDGARSASDNGTYYGGGVADDSYSHSTAPYPSSNTGQAAVGGEASSFYASSGTTPQDPGQSTYTNQTQPPQSFDANGQPIQGSGDGERGLGKMIVGGGAIYLAYKLYKDYQKGKLKQDYFVPPNQVHAPHGSYQYHHNASDHLRPSQSINPAAQMSNSTSKFPTTSDLYPGPPLDPYNSGATNSQVVSRPFFSLPLLPLLSRKILINLSYS